MGKLTGAGAPSIQTQGEVGQFYENTKTGDIYELQSISKNCHGSSCYSWQLIMNGAEAARQAAILGTKETVDALAETVLQDSYVNLLKNGTTVSNQYDVIKALDGIAANYRFDAFFPLGKWSDTVELGKIELYHMDMLLYSLCFASYLREDGTGYSLSTCDCNYRNASLAQVKKYGFEAKFYNNMGDEISADTINIPLYMRFCPIDAVTNLNPAWWEQTT